MVPNNFQQKVSTLCNSDFFFVRMKFVGIEKSSSQHHKNDSVFEAFSPFLR